MLENVHENLLNYLYFQHFRDISLVILCRNRPPYKACNKKDIRLLTAYNILKYFLFRFKDTFDILFKLGKIHMLPRHTVIINDTTSVEYAHQTINIIYLTIILISMKIFMKT